MKRLARSAVLAAAALAAVGGLSGCRTSPGAAALVGDERISTDTLQREVNDALANPQAESALGADRASFTRTELGRLINNVIIAAAAREHHITVSESDIQRQLDEFAAQAGGRQQLLEQAGQSGIPPRELRDFTRYYVMQQKLGDQLVANYPVSRSDLRAAYQQNIDTYDQVHSAHILVKTKKLADTILAQVRSDPSKFDSLAAKYSQDTSNKDSGGDLGFAGKGQFVPEFSDAIFAAKPGSFIEVRSQFGWHVVHVIAHKHVSLAKAAPDLKTTILKDIRDRLLQELLTRESRALGVHVNPRYGRWNAVNGSVTPPSMRGSVSSPSPSPGGGGGLPGAPTG